MSIQIDQVKTFVYLIIFFYFQSSLFKAQAQTVDISTAIPSYWSTFWSLENDIKEHPDLNFEKPIIYKNDSRWVNQIFLPNDKPGPFPVIVVLPDCGSVGTHNLEFMEKALQRGYASMVFDTHRGVKSNCNNNKLSKFIKTDSPQFIIFVSSYLKYFLLK